MEQEIIGGIAFADVVAFQLRLMFGERNYSRIEKAENEEDIVIACLRLASNDAFRHVTKNNFSSNTEIRGFLKEKERNSGKKYSSLDDYVCEEVIRNIYSIYVDYVTIKGTSERTKKLEENIRVLCDAYKELKVTEASEKTLCFGHFQKMFNMATKNYLCVYMCRKQLEEVFGHQLPIGKTITQEHLASADCPVDSYILGALDKEKSLGKTKYKTGKYSDLKWSKIGTDQYSIEDYKNVQGAIKTLCDEGESNLSYDFHRWNIRE